MSDNNMDDSTGDQPIPPEAATLEQQLEGLLELQQLAHALSHDVRAPIRHINGYLSLLAARYAEHFDDDGREFMHYARDGAEQAQTMLDAVVRYLRTGHHDTTLSPIDLAAPLYAALDQHQAAITATAAEIDIALTRPVTVPIDPAQCQQLFFQLFDNAIKFRRHGAPPRITVSARQVTNGDGTGNAVWQIAVSDNGIGVVAGQEQRIFALLQRLHTRSDYPGIGLGLALCKRIVTSHGGRIWVESSADRGSTFYVSLPAVS